jgi:hypothetical protein
MEETPKIIAESNGHKWIEDRGMVYCLDCGWVRRPDDKNKPCQGKAEVGLRTTTTTQT